MENDLLELNDMAVNSKRCLTNGEYSRAYDIAQDILNIDNSYPEALLYAGLSLGKNNPHNAYAVASYTADAIKSKNERCENQREFYDFLDEALQCMITVIETGVNGIVNSVYSDAFGQYQESSRQFNAKWNEEEFRSKVSRGEEYHAKFDTPGILQTSLNSLASKSEANSVRANILNDVRPKLTEIEDFVLELDYEEFNENMIKSILKLISINHNSYNGISKQITYSNRLEKQKELERMINYLAMTEKRIKDNSVYLTINRMKMNIQMGIKRTKKIQPSDIALNPTFVTFSILLGFCWGILPLGYFIIYLIGFIRKKIRGTVNDGILAEKTTIPFTTELQKKAIKNLIILGVIAFVWISPFVVLFTLIV